MATTAHSVQGPFNGNGDDGGGPDSGICGAILAAFCASFCKDNPLAESFGMNQPEPAAGGGGGGGGGGQPARGGYPDHGGGGGGGGGGFASYGGGGFAPPDGILVDPVPAQSKTFLSPRDNLLNHFSLSVCVLCGNVVRAYCDKQSGYITQESNLSSQL